MCHFYLQIEVCKSCGIVVEDTTLSSAECVVSRSTFTPFSRSEARLHKKKSKPIPLIHGLRVLDNLCHVNSITSSSAKAEVTALFKLVVSVRRFSKKEDGGTAVACCLFLLLRKNKETIPINTLCKQVPCTKRKFSFFLKFLKSCLSCNEKFKQYSFILDNNVYDSQQKEEDEIPDIVPSLIREICVKAETEEKAQLMDKTASLVKLAYSCWLFTGRSPRSVVVASAFLSWKSMLRIRKSISFANFCNKFEIHERTAVLRIPELKALLLKLGKMIPSRTENYVNENNLLFHLNTILEHSETLRNDLFPDSYTCNEVDTAEFSNFRYPSIKINRHPRKEASDAVHYDSDMNASDVEIPDSEIDSYLVSDKKKIIDFCKTQNLKSTNNFSLK